MPTYDYECSQCEAVFEVFQNMSEESITSCRQCGGPVRRLIGGGLGVIFRGSGFYSTDSKTGAQQSGPKKQENSTPSPAGGEASTGSAPREKKSKKEESSKEPVAAKA